MNEAINIVKSLLAVLPDSEQWSKRGKDCWRWCWDELSDDAQEEVKAARKAAATWLKQQKQEGQ